MYRLTVAVIRLIALYFLVSFAASLLVSIISMFYEDALWSKLHPEGYMAVVAIAWLLVFILLWLAAPWIAALALPRAVPEEKDTPAPSPEAIGAVLFVGLGAYWIGDAIVMSGETIVRLASAEGEMAQHMYFANYGLIWEAVLQMGVGRVAIVGSSFFARLLARVQRSRPQ